ncbi:MAG: hypothetical protein FWD93_05030 [Coriobacteriia bacterium]|nr:hypothetical protein [Coriobacteriia bacterium]
MKQIHFEAMGELLISGEPLEGNFLEAESLELVVKLDDSWQSADKVLALFNGGGLPASRPVELQGDTCLIPKAALAGDWFTFVLVGQSGGRTTAITNGLNVSLSSGNVEEAEFAPVSVDLLVWLWEQYESGIRVRVDGNKLFIATNGTNP